MTTTSRQARLEAPRVRDTLRLQSRPGHRAAAVPETAAARADDAPSMPASLALRRLANRLATYAPHDGAFPLRLPGTYAVRVSRMTTETAYATLGPALCVAVALSPAVDTTSVLSCAPIGVLIVNFQVPSAAMHVSLSAFISH